MKKQLLLILFIISFGLFAQTIKYVKQGATGSGSSWADAGDLQAMIDACPSGGEVWVAKGTYIPNREHGTGYTENVPNPLSKKNFKLKSGVLVYGGFNGTETSRWDRNIKNNPTIINGNRAYQTVLAVNCGSGTVLDGFTITGGEASTQTMAYYVDGVRLSGSSGAGVYLKNGNVVVKNCTFKNNKATQDNATGAALFSNGGTSWIVDCRFENNVSSNGGAIFIKRSTSEINGCIITKNTAQKNGSNAYGYGGGIQIYGSTVKVIKSTIANNKASRGGAIWINKIGSSTSNVTIENTIVWGNTGSKGVSQDNSTVKLSHSIIEATSGAMNKTNVYNKDPLFLETTNYTLREDSPAIDKGKGTPTGNDINGNFRVEGKTIDIGASELKDRTQNLIFKKGNKIVTSYTVQYGANNNIFIPTVESHDRNNKKTCITNFLYSIVGTSDVAEVVGNQIKIKKAGTVTIKATTPGWNSSNTEGVCVVGGSYSPYATTSYFRFKQGTKNFTLKVTKKTVTITNVKANNKVYNGNKTATLSSKGTLKGVISGDNVSFTTSGNTTFNNKNVGNNKAITLPTYTLTGADASKYTLTQPTGVTANITKKTVTITGITASNKPYDGNTTATVTKGTLNGQISGDNVSITKGTGAFDTKDVGAGKTVTLSGYGLSGADAGNYNLTAPSPVTADITQASLTVNATITNKVYDGTTKATISNATLNNSPAGVTLVTTGVTANFADKNVANGKAISFSGNYSLSGANAGNYSLTQPTGVTADITPKPITIENIKVDDKEYDGTNTATLSSKGTLKGQISGDNVSFTTSGTTTFDDKNVGTNKAITLPTYTLMGTDAANYTLTQPTNVKANITKKPVTITGITASDKPYDGNTTATVTTGTLNGQISGDDVAITKGTGTFDTKDAGTNKTVTLSGYGLTGADAKNYNLTAPSPVTANITEVSLIVNATVANKVYDGTTNATISDATLNNSPTGVILVTTGVTANFADKNVANGKTISFSGTYSLSGANANNYVLTQPTGVTADITPKSITIENVKVEDKEYDGTNTANLSSKGTLKGQISGDNVSFTTSGTTTFDDKNVGTNKAITLPTYTLAGTDAGNYILTQPTTKANIVKKDLTIAIQIEDKYYDGNTKATVKGTPSLNGIISGDVVNLDSSNVVFNFVDKKIGTNKKVNFTGTFVLSGTDSPNYNLIPPKNLKATIKDNYEIKKEDVIDWTQKLVLGCDGLNTLTLTATSESGLPVTYVCSDPSVGVINGDEFVMTKRAKLTITAYFPGDELNYRPSQMTREVEFKLEGLVRQHWDDTLFFDNSSKEYVAWEWYKDEQLVPNMKKQYYHEKTRLNGTYYAKVTDIKGDVYETCPIVLSNEKPRVDNLRIYPNPVKAGDNFYIESGLFLKSLVNSKITIFDISGKKVQTIENIGLRNNAKAPANSGMYIILLELQNGKKESKNLLVK